MIRIKEAIIVEGKYDKIKLSSLVDGLIIETGGFRIFKDPEKMALLRRLAATRGLLILTDSDGAEFSNLIDSQTLESITLNVTKAPDSGYPVGEAEESE